MHHVVIRLRGVRMVVVLVERWQLAPQHSDSLISQLQCRFALPAMLVSRDDATWSGSRARAQFDYMPYFYDLLAIDDLDWLELPAAVEPELPF